MMHEGAESNDHNRYEEDTDIDFPTLRRIVMGYYDRRKNERVPGLIEQQGAMIRAQEKFTTQLGKQHEAMIKAQDEFTAEFAKRDKLFSRAIMAGLFLIGVPAIHAVGVPTQLLGKLLSGFLGVHFSEGGLP
jgi:hypothetical protein